MRTDARRRAPLPTVGSQPPKTETVSADPSRCRKCGSTERTGYGHTREVAHGGVHEGQAYTHVVWRRTSCTNCGQVRDDISRENRL